MKDKVIIFAEVNNVEGWLTISKTPMDSGENIRLLADNKVYRYYADTLNFSFNDLTATLHFTGTGEVMETGASVTKVLMSGDCTINIKSLDIYKIKQLMEE